MSTGVKPTSSIRPETMRHHFAELRGLARLSRSEVRRASMFQP